MKKIQKILFIFLFILPFILGTIGYLLCGAEFLDSLYGAFSLYVVSPTLETKNAFIEIARWTAPLVVASGVILAIKTTIQYIKDFFCCFHADATAIYGDSELCDMVKKSTTHAVYIKDGNVKDVNNHIIVFKDDASGLKFYKDNASKFKNKDVYLKLENADSYRTQFPDVIFFNPNEIISRKFWAENNLMKYYTEDGISLKIAIIGFGPLGENLLNNAILNNIYSLNQKIEYHIWGDSVLYSSLRRDFNFMNNDTMVFHSASWHNDIHEIAAADRVIITETGMNDLIVALNEICTETEIYVYDPDSSLVNIYGNKNLHTFGRYDEILTGENIRTDALYRLAKELNYSYACLYDEDPGGDKEIAMEKCWRKLDNFTKGSNIASADYQRIREFLMNKSTEIDDTIAELEHIRWCRYHFLNHWKPGLTPDGKKDKAAKIHPCLVPYRELSQADKNKDFEAVEVLLGIKH